MSKESKPVVKDDPFGGIKPRDEIAFEKLKAVHEPDKAPEPVQYQKSYEKKDVEYQKPAYKASMYQQEKYPEEKQEVEGGYQESYRGGRYGYEYGQQRRGGRGRTYRPYSGYRGRSYYQPRGGYQGGYVIIMKTHNRKRKSIQKKNTK